MTGRSIQRYFWIIPLIMMAVAAIACDSPTYDPPQVREIQADASIPGKAYLRLSGNTDFKYGGGEGDVIDRRYETRDYGQTWVPTTATIIFEKKPIDAFVRSGETFYLKGATPKESRAIWTFPRATFRSFFFEGGGFGSGNDTPYFMLPYNPSYTYSAADPHVIYISLGTEGVLIGPNPYNTPPPGRTVEWSIRRAGLSELRPLALTITDPFAILGIIAFALIIPPLPFLHGAILNRIYRYAFQPGERREPVKLAAQVTGAVTVCAVGAIIFWLTNVQTDYYPVVAVMTVVCAAFSIGGGVRISRKRQFSNQFTRRMALASGLSALIVPVGVAAIWVGWPFILTSILLFTLFQFMTMRALDKGQAIATNWQLDRFTLEVCAAVGFIAVPIGGLTAGVLGLRGVNSILVFPLAFLVLAISVSVVYLFIRVRGRFALKKKSGVEGLEETPLFQGFRWWRRLFAYAAVWALASGFASFGVFIGQAFAYSWFSKLLINF